jgi:hypothetical protein
MREQNLATTTTTTTKIARQDVWDDGLQMVS